jgi:hypothetical protein
MVILLKARDHQGCLTNTLVWPEGRKECWTRDAQAHGEYSPTHNTAPSIANEEQGGHRPADGAPAVPIKQVATVESQVNLGPVAGLAIYDGETNIKSYTGTIATGPFTMTSSSHAQTAAGDRPMSAPIVSVSGKYMDMATGNEICISHI